MEIEEEYTQTEKSVLRNSYNEEKKKDKKGEVSKKKTNNKLHSSEEKGQEGRKWYNASYYTTIDG